MNKPFNILLVGAGGIGSYLTWNLNELHRQNQLEDVILTIADSDTVEKKNLSYQWFTADEIFDNKAESLAAKCKVVQHTLPHFIETAGQMEPYDLIISAVDNTKFRKLLYEYAIPLNKPWLDLRSEGTSCAFFAQHPLNTVDAMLKTIPQEKVNQSCQRGFEFEQNIIQLGNRIIASIGAQQVLTYLRTGAFPLKSYRGMF